MDEPATNELLDRWVRGDAAAAEEIYTSYIERVERFAMKFTRDTVLSEEVAAETLARGLAEVREGQKPARLTHWLFGIAKRLAVIRHRTEERETAYPTELLGAIPSPRTLSIQGEIAGVLRAAIEKLPASCREVIDLHGEDLDRGEIAERLGISRETVDRRFARAYETLRGAIEDHVTGLVAGPRAVRKVRWEDVAALRPSFRQALVARHLEGRTRDEVAQALGLPPETVDARLATAYEQLGCRPDDDFSLARNEYLRSL